MASSSQQPTDFTSQSQMTIEPTVDVESASSEVLSFDCIFRATYLKKGQFGPSGKAERREQLFMNAFSVLLIRPGQTPNETTLYTTPNTNIVISLTLQTIQYTNDHRTWDLH
ncbi:hypothetical protein FOTG_15870 [Fusarium oxysporum f. sp. vasinfectum 25433]|uniref:Uncharacterized protein n=1 Tax=Fusarium oxysporum f. sp. vasinfectum 25433 TaxID=1089449 RepID=X0KQB5_FUSOX|nr:hypothetical protein FOTG_15870 [Fusarium oxysporum f. sp. vasinfectum 25433]